MSDLLKRLEPGNRKKPGAADFAQMRKVPLQPEGLPLGLVFMGADLGNLPWSGARPRAGDTVAVIGAPGNRTVIARGTKPLRDPAFFGRCSCRCPGSSAGGMIYYLSRVSNATNLIVVDGATGAALLFSVLPEVILGQGIAVDPETADLYILDNRQSTQNLEVDGALSPDPAKQWYFLLKYARTGDDYVLSAAELLPGFSLDQVTTQDVNPLSVLDGACQVTVGVSPARILRWSGAGFTALALTLEGEPYDAALFGPVVRVGARPAPTASRFVLALVDGSTVEVVQFAADGAIQQRLQDAELTSARALLTVCNRLTAFRSPGSGRGTEEDDGGDGGGDDGGGGELPPGVEEG